LHAAEAEPLTDAMTLDDGMRLVPLLRAEVGVVKNAFTRIDVYALPSVQVDTQEIGPFAVPVPPPVAL
jgi:hypothetical protein